MTIHLFHGIHTPTGDRTVEGLIPYLKAVEPTLYPDMGWIAAVESRRINPVVCGSVLPYIKPGDILMGHSNGCSIIDHLLWAGAPAAGVVYIDGALTTDFKLPDCVKWCHVYWNPGDNITEVAEIAEKVFLSPVDANWGDLGHAGYSGSDPRVTVNQNCGATIGMLSVDGHSDIFTAAKLAVWGPYIDARILSAMQASTLPLAARSSTLATADRQASEAYEVPGAPP